MPLATSSMTEDQIVERYERLTAARTSFDHCLICNRSRPLVTAYVLGPSQIGYGPRIARRGHGVCRPCIKAGAALAARRA